MILTLQQIPAEKRMKGNPVDTYPQRVERKRDQQGRVIYEIRYDRKGLATGLYRGYNYNKSGLHTITTGYFKSGKRDSLWIETDAKGGYLEVKHYRNDLLHGSYSRYFPNHRIEIKGYYKQGRESGKWYAFSVNGSPESEMTYHPGYRHVRNFYPNRKLESEGNEKISYDASGVMTACADGTWTHFDENRNKSSRYFDKGVDRGITNFYRPDNTLDRQLERVGPLNKKYYKLIQFDLEGNIGAVDYHNDHHQEISRKEYEVYKLKYRKSIDTPCKE